MYYLFDYCLANHDPITTPVIAARAPVSIGGKKCPIINCITNIADHSPTGRSMRSKSFVEYFISKKINIVNILNKY